MRAFEAIAVLLVVATGSVCPGLAGDSGAFPPAEGGCCTLAPNNPGECVIDNQDACLAGGGVYLGDGTDCAGAALQCRPLNVTLDSFSATSTRHGVLIAWTTATEFDTIGFRVLRQVIRGDGAQKDAGKIEIISPLIPASGLQLRGSSYEFLDRKPAARGPSLVYYLEDIDIFGRVTRHEPVRVDQPSRREPARRIGRAGLAR